MIENIKILYNQLHDKVAFVQLVAKEFDNKPQSIANNWFSRFWSVPDVHQPRVVELLQNTIANQNQKVSA